MKGLALYDWYEREEIVALFGSVAEARERCGGQWIMFPTISVCLATVGESSSFFRAATKFVWVTEECYRWGDPTAFVPKEVRGGKEKGRDLFLFARKGTSQRYRYLGRLQPTYAVQHASRDRHGQADFDLSPALPSGVWAEMGGFDPGDLNHDRIDTALDRLRNRTSAADRMEVLRQLVEYWYGAVGPDDGFDEAELNGIRMPMVLRDWYRWAGKRPEIMGGQNYLLAPRNNEKGHGGLRIKDGRLVFYVENQCVYQWSTMDEGEDPPVFGRYEDSDPWLPEGTTVSEHLILACLFDAILCVCKYGASNAWLEEEKVNEIAEHIPPLALGTWGWMGPTRFYGRHGAFMCAASNGESNGRKGMCIWIGAKTEQPLQFLKPYLGKDWEYVAL
jgi:hypothetical protein